MINNIYIIGHKSPDLDSVAGAIAYAELKNNLEKTDVYTPAVSGDVNMETAYLLSETNFEVPEKISNISGKKVILVDHNEKSQSCDGIDDAEILEVLDHHKVNFNFESPILFRSFPVGSVCTVIADEFFKYNIEISQNLAKLILGAIMIDTVITKSPTCTEKDIEIIEKLSRILGNKDWKNFGLELFKVRSDVSKLSAKEIIMSDFKDFDTSSGKLGIGQVETVDLSEFDSVQDEILKSLEDIKNSNNYHTVILFITDILKEGSLFLIATNEPEKIQKSFDKKFENNKEYIDGILSRKKQVIPKIMEIY